MKAIHTVALFLSMLTTVFAAPSYSGSLPFKATGENASALKLGTPISEYQNHLLGAAAIAERYNTEFESTSLQRMQGLRTRQISNASDIFAQCVGSVVFIGTEDGIGAGIIIGENEILTNYHVVRGYEVVQYLLWDSTYTTLRQLDSDRILDADVVAVDRARDLALLSSQSKRLKSGWVVQLGSTSDIRIAQDAFAIGHPQGLIWSFTYGVISGLPTPYVWTYEDGSEYTANCIQTQTPINPGNSGGPLFNAQGLLIGVNSMGMDAQGLNFAIRLDEIIDFLGKAKAGIYPRGELEEQHQWERIETHELKNVYKLLGLDSNDDGNYDAWLVFEDSDDIADLGLFDLNHDSIVDAMCNVETKTWYFDNNGDGEWDRKGWDTDGDDWPDEFVDL